MSSRCNSVNNLNIINIEYSIQKITVKQKNLLDPVVVVAENVLLLQIFRRNVPARFGPPQPGDIRFDYADTKKVSALLFSWTTCRVLEETLDGAVWGGDHRSAFLASDLAISQKGPGNLCADARTSSRARTNQSTSSLVTTNEGATFSTS